jgi:3-hydroxybutyryl-CoA dehydrogenase
MKLAVLATPDLRNELKDSPLFSDPSFLPASSPEELVSLQADAYFDLCFEMNATRINLLSTVLPAPVFINAVAHTLQEIQRPFIRLNGWPGFLAGKVWELAAGPEQQKAAVPVLQSIGQDHAFVEDVPGLVTPRILTMIISEAFLTLEAGVSSRAEIDRAMKLGAGYPFGPFEWAARIGPARIRDLLKALEKTDPLYRLPETLDLSL